MKKFTTKLAIFGKGRCSGFGISGDVNPKAVAELIFGKELNGANLFAYLFRRFGYPNVGWDDYKNLVCYALTTPMPGLYLTVTPYLGGSQGMSGLHFGCLMNEAIAKRMGQNGNALYIRRARQVERWANKKLVWWKHEPNDPPRVVVHNFEKDGLPTGHAIVLRDKTDRKSYKFKLPKRNTRRWHNMMFFLMDIYAELHPQPKNSFRRRKRMEIYNRPWHKKPRNFIYQMHRAFHLALLDLKSPTNVRDVYIDATGRVPDEKVGESNTVPFYEHAGCTAQYLVKEKLLKESFARKTRRGRKPFAE